VIAATVVSISEGGFAVETTARVEQGEPVRLRFQAQGSVPEFEVEALVWYGQVARGGERRRLGCVMPDRDPAFLQLFAAVERRNGPRERPNRVARVASLRQRLREEEPDLPRSREPLPPPKPEPEETLPAFRVRLRQIGGPRTRNVSVQACSIVQAAERARDELSASGLDPESWAILEVTPVGDAPARPGA
jgi:hypothetical protein